MHDDYEHFAARLNNAIVARAVTFFFLWLVAAFIALVTLGIRWTVVLEQLK